MIINESKLNEGKKSVDEFKVSELLNGTGIKMSRGSKNYGPNSFHFTSKFEDKVKKAFDAILNYCRKFDFREAEWHGRFEDKYSYWDSSYQSKFSANVIVEMLQLPYDKYQLNVAFRQDMMNLNESRINESGKVIKINKNSSYTLTGTNSIFKEYDDDEDLAEDLAKKFFNPAVKACKGNMGDFISIGYDFEGFSNPADFDYFYKYLIKNSKRVSTIRFDSDIGSLKAVIYSIGNYMFFSEVFDGDFYRLWIPKKMYNEYNGKELEV